MDFLDEEPSHRMLSPKTVSPKKSPTSNKQSRLFFGANERSPGDKAQNAENRPIFNSLKILLKTQVAAIVDRYVSKHKPQANDQKTMIKTFNEIFYAKLYRILSVICTARRSKFFELIRFNEEKQESIRELWEELSKTFEYLKSHRVMNVDIHRDFVKRLTSHEIIYDEMEFFLAYHFNNTEAVLEILNDGEKSEDFRKSVEILPDGMRKEAQKIRIDPLSQTAPIGKSQTNEIYNIHSKYPLKGLTKTMGDGKSQERPEGQYRRPSLSLAEEQTGQVVRRTVPAPGKSSMAQERAHNDSDLISFITDAEIAEHKRKVQFLKDKQQGKESLTSNKASRSEVSDNVSKGLYQYSDHNSEKRDDLNDFERFLF